ncbi:enoyl-CoA hydratase/isomerase family protein [Limibaculum sp. M0105]|uniref:Enoyl-CoA hydratase/isomerase family protein n=1 Tax=Thermohalobaculum xanthum TaxID=2753746 RepID=A0A8J7M801_9RHOB|nr:enoyl-CoA hydratase family protein [Thermohalobaculum xanthum]MBK0400264.1 enoyl-CoA hydratase/isomerase family protein [Thermohalobaculum xanthum]
MTEGRIGLERKDAVLTVTNNDPATRNALSWDFYDGFREILDEAADDARTRAIVLTGAGGFFCSGGNVSGLAERARATHAVRRSSVERLHGMIRAMRGCPKPIVAAIEGGAAGAGVSMALACDLIVAARESYVSVAYVRIGLTPDGGATAMLGRALPRQLVTEMVMTGDRVGAERLHALGLVNRLTAPGAALAEAQALAARLAEGPAGALAAGKALIGGAAEESLDGQLDAEAAAIAEALGGREAAEGIAAFLEKRKPRW